MKLAYYTGRVPVTGYYVTEKASTYRGEKTTKQLEVLHPEAWDDHAEWMGESIIRWFGPLEFEE